VEKSFTLFVNDQTMGVQPMLEVIFFIQTQIIPLLALSFIWKPDDRFLQNTVIFIRFWTTPWWATPIFIRKRIRHPPRYSGVLRQLVIERLPLF